MATLRWFCSFLSLVVLGAAACGPESGGQAPGRGDVGEDTLDARSASDAGARDVPRDSETAQDVHAHDVFAADAAHDAQPEGPICGNGELDPGEECDGELLADCVDLGFDGGETSCSDCRRDVSVCFLGPRCGNGVVETHPGQPESSEECDDGNRISGDGCSAGCVAEVCGNSTLDAGEECESGLARPSCAEFGGDAGELGCVGCRLDASGCLPLTTSSSAGT